ncbi:heavy metal-binding domain-containing protein [soil metagenome]
MASIESSLPAAARERIERQAASGVRSSLFSTPAAAAAQSAGLMAVGEVFGCLVMNLGWAGIGCGWYGQTTTMGGVGRGYPTPNWGVTTMPRSPVTTSGHGGRNSGMKPYVTAVETGWHGALGRLLAEAKALGAHGVVGITIRRKHLQNQVWEFTALGTAVRSIDPVLAPRPAGGGVWSTDLSAEDTASAILSGFMPHEVIMGMSVATKHEDWQMRNQRTSGVNGEVDGLTELIRAARNEARARLESRANHAAGATLVITQMGLREFETACSGAEGRDSNAEATFVGTTLVPIPRFLSVGSAKSPVLTVMPLRDSMKGNS